MFVCAKYGVGYVINNAAVNRAGYIKVPGCVFVVYAKESTLGVGVYVLVGQVAINVSGINPPGSAAVFKVGFATGYATHI